MSIAIETALMGVPTVTMLGDGIQSRGAGRINKIINLEELNAHYGDEYVEIAAKLATDKKKLQDLRFSLRERINNSDLRQNALEFTKNLEAKYKEAWEKFINSP